MCRTWLKYIAPLLADATQAEGHFSLTLDGASVPLATPQATRAQGVMTIHEAQVGPGPLSREFLGIAQQIKAIVQRRPFGAQDGAVSQQWLTLPAQDVAFEMADGRVRHRGFQWRVSGVSMRTQGWVGLDQSLALEAEIPIQDEWVQSDRFLSALKGQVVRIPVGGELSRPRIDQRVLRELASQTLGGAATKLLENELNRGLQQLFGRSPQAKP
jgi:hypothetical protein